MKTDTTYARACAPGHTHTHKHTHIYIHIFTGRPRNFMSIFRDLITELMLSQKAIYM